jgi:hypothetical protein
MQDVLVVIAARISVGPPRVFSDDSNSNIDIGIDIDIDIEDDTTTKTLFPSSVISSVTSSAI